MKLLMDFGNSRCKFAMQENKSINKIESISYSDTDRLYVIKSLLDKINNLKQVIICSVLDSQINLQLERLLADYKIEQYYFLDADTESFGITLDHYNAKQLGADRLAAMIGAQEKFKGTKCIIDCGTAITIDVLDSNSKHLGGVILPDVHSMQNSLLLDTNIKLNKETVGFNVFARSTQEAIHTGCLSAVVGGIQYVINEMQTKIGLFDKIILTGGNARSLLPMLSSDAVLEPTLVLDGLMIISRKL